MPFLGATTGACSLGFSDGGGYRLPLFGGRGATGFRVGGVGGLLLLRVLLVELGPSSWYC